MADYYSLLEKAVSGLKTPTRECRRAIYQRARKAMLSNLRCLEPPVPESEVERERLALEAAISRLEREFFYFPPVAIPADDAKSDAALADLSREPPRKLRSALGHMAARLRTASADRKQRRRLRNELAALGLDSDES